MTTPGPTTPGTTTPSAPTTPGTTTPSAPTGPVGAAPPTTRASGRPGTSRPSLAGLTFSVVPHTHWDREWYLPFEVFRIKLCRVLDEALDAMDTDERLRYFTLDGQAALLDDYLALRPEREEQLRRLVACGRLAVGPAYVLPDEFLISGETHVRNFLMGRRTVERLGGTPMAIGYQPDSFGHIAQMPQILAGFGLEGFVFWRGLGDEVDRLGPVFLWVSPDGTSVLAVRQLDGYGGGHDLGRWIESGVSVHGEPGRWEEAAANQFVRFIRRHDSLARRSAMKHLALANGGDHVPLQADLPAMLDAARSAHPDAVFQVDRYDRYVDALRAAGLPELETFEGELVGAREAFVLRGVNSSRMYLKQAAEQVERHLLTVETLASLAAMSRGTAYPGAELAYAWREVLRNAPHDSITGCSIDEVHRGMVDRYARAEQVAWRLRHEALAAIVGTRAPWNGAIDRSAVRSIVNPLPQPRRRAVAFHLPTSLQGATRLVLDRLEGLIPVQILEIDGEPQGVAVPDVPGFGGITFSIRRGTPGPADRTGSEARALDGRTIANDRYTVRATGGCFEVRDLRTGRLWDEVGWLEDVADRGDEYSFRGIDDEVPWTSLSAGIESSVGTDSSANVRLVASGPLVAELEVSFVARLPRRLAAGLDTRSAELVDVPVTTRARLVAGVERIEFVTTVDNRAEDHRLRVRFGDPEPVGGVRAESQFAVLRRAPGAKSEGNGWHEQPPETDHTSGFVAAGSLAIAGRGLPEYEAVRRTDGGLDIALTLLRCVGMLARDLPSRAGRAGPGIPTPDAQCYGVHQFEYAVWSAIDVTDLDLAQASLDYRTDFEAGPAGPHPAPGLMLGPSLVFSTLKAAEDGDGWIVRGWNPEPVEVVACVETPDASLVVERCRLDEMGLRRDAQVDRRVAPSGIATFRVRRSKPI